MPYPATPCPYDGDPAPVPRRPFQYERVFHPVVVRNRHDGWTADKQTDFVAALGASGCVTDACRSVGMSTESAYKLRARPDATDFRLAWAAALDFAVDRLDHAVLDRAINGVAVPHYFKGEVVGEHRRYDERLALFLLRYRRPLTYARHWDRQEHTDGHPEDIAERFGAGLHVVRADLTREELDRVRAQRRRETADTAAIYAADYAATPGHDADEAELRFAEAALVASEAKALRDAIDARRRPKIEDLARRLAAAARAGAVVGDAADGSKDTATTDAAVAASGEVAGEDLGGSGDEAPGDVALLSSTSAPDDHDGGGSGGGGGGGDIITGSDSAYAPNHATTPAGAAATRAVWQTLLTASDEPGWRATIRASTPPGMFDAPDDAGDGARDGGG